MKQLLLILWLLCLSALLPLLAEEPPVMDEEYMGFPIFPELRVSLVEGEAFRLADNSDDWERVVRNGLVQIGDRVVTTENSRLELQTSAYSYLRCPANTRFDVQNIQKQETTTAVILHLMTGSIYVRNHAMAIDHSYLIQVYTPTALVRLARDGAVRVDISGSGGTVVRVDDGVVEMIGGRRSIFLAAGEMSLIEPNGVPHNPLPAGDHDYTGFDLWNLELDREWQAPAYPEYDMEGMADLNDYGDWIEIENYGRCWRPTVAASWSPYYQGYWHYWAPYGWYWMSYEPWGWAPYHYGTWIWTGHYGWSWVPGRHWGPAWTWWWSSNGYYYWTPRHPHDRYRWDRNHRRYHWDNNQPPINTRLKKSRAFMRVKLDALPNADPDGYWRGNADEVQFAGFRFTGNPRAVPRPTVLVDRKPKPLRLPRSVSEKPEFSRLNPRSPGIDRSRPFSAPSQEPGNVRPPGGSQPVTKPSNKPRSVSPPVSTRPGTIDQPAQSSSSPVTNPSSRPRSVHPPVRTRSGTVDQPTQSSSSPVTNPSSKPRSAHPPVGTRPDTVGQPSQSNSSQVSNPGTAKVDKTDKKGKAARAKKAKKASAKTAPVTPQESQQLESE